MGSFISFKPGFLSFNLLVLLFSFKPRFLLVSLFYFKHRFLLVSLFSFKPGFLLGSRFSFKPGFLLDPLFSFKPGLLLGSGFCFKPGSYWVQCSLSNQDNNWFQGSFLTLVLTGFSVLFQPWREKKTCIFLMKSKNMIDQKCSQKFRIR